MSKDSIEEQPWFRWMEEVLRGLYEDNPTSILIAARLEGGGTMTAYYRADVEDIAVMLCHIKGDMVLDFIEDNADAFRDILGIDGEEEEVEEE